MGFRFWGAESLEVGIFEGDLESAGVLKDHFLSEAVGVLVYGEVIWGEGAEGD